MANWGKESWITDQIACWLENQGWTILQKNPQRGADIIAEMAGLKWIIEVKGLGSRSEMRNNYFVYALGQLLQRMSEENCKYSVAFPEHEKFRRLWRELPPLAKSRADITALFVSESGQVKS